MSPVRFLASSVGRKLVIALTGLALLGFLVAHLAGNLLVFVPGEAFNDYAHKLVSNKLLLYAAEVGLLVIFLVHVGATVMNWLRNRAARPVAYEKKQWAGPPSRKTVASTTMIATGAFTFLFIVLHLKTFKWGTYYWVGDQAAGVRDLARLVREVFASPAWVGFYVASMIVLGLHLRHGFMSAFQSLGADHPVVSPKLRALGVVVAVVIAGGFALIPLVLFAIGGRS